jgi:hypothetical protein
MNNFENSTFTKSLPLEGLEIQGRLDLIYSVVCNKKCVYYSIAIVDSSRTALIYFDGDEETKRKEKGRIFVR